MTGGHIKNNNNNPKKRDSPLHAIRFDDDDDAVSWIIIINDRAVS